MESLNPLLPPQIWRALLRLSAFLLAAAFFAGRAVADDSDSAWTVRNWGSESGLPIVEDNQVVQSADGFLWVATLQGVFRFDGVHFTAVDVPQLSHEYDNACYVIYAARDGSVWWGLDHGRVVCWRNGAISVWQKAEGVPDDHPVNICENKEGAIFISFHNSGVIEIDKGKVTAFPLNDVTPRHNAWCLAGDGEGNAWCAVGGALFEFRNGTFVKSADLPPEMMPSGMEWDREGGFWVWNGHEIDHVIPGGGIDQTIIVTPGIGYISAFHQDQAGNMWAGTTNSVKNGLYLVEGGNFIEAGEEKYRVSSIMSDREGNVWLSTFDDGIQQVRPRLIRFLTVDPTFDVWGRIFSFARDTSGSVWMVFEDNSVYRQVGGQWAKVVEFAHNSGAVGRGIAVEAAADGSVYIGTWAKGVFRCTGTTGSPATLAVDPKISHVITMLCARSGDIWVSGESGRVDCIHPDGKVDSLTNPDGATAPLLAEDAKGNILMAGERGGAGAGGLYQVVDGQIAQLRFEGDRKFTIRGLCCDKEGGTWIGFLGGGLGRLKDGKFVRAMATDGLPDNYIYQMVPDNLGRIWILSNAGLSRIDIADFDHFAAGDVKRLRVATFAQEEKAFDTQTAARSIGSLIGHCCRLVGDEIWFSYGNGILIVDSRARPRNEVPPQVSIESVRVDGRDVPLDGSAIKLPPYLSRIEFNYAALSFDAPENNQYRYMLEGYDKQWNEAGADRQAVYSRLAAGRYRFRVIACNSDGVWSQAGGSVAFTVTPFYWQTWWFQLAVLAALIACVVVIVRFVSYRRLRWKLQLSEQQAALDRERLRIARDIHDEVGANLTQIAITSKLAQLDPLEAIPGHIAEVASIARSTVESLDGIVWAVNPRYDTFSGLAEYLGKYAVTFMQSSGITCKVDSPNGVPPRAIASNTRHHLFLVAKEALNNIAKHAEAKVTTLKVEMTSSLLRIVIADDGRGFVNGREEPDANGLRNMRERMAEVGGFCRVETSPGKGTRVTFELPLRGE